MCVHVDCSWSNVSNLLSSRSEANGIGQEQEAKDLRIVLSIRQAASVKPRRSRQRPINDTYLEKSDKKKLDNLLQNFVKSNTPFGYKNHNLRAFDWQHGGLVRNDVDWYGLLYDFICIARARWTVKGIWRDFDPRFFLGSDWGIYEQHLVRRELNGYQELSLVNNV